MIASCSSDRTNPGDPEISSALCRPHRSARRPGQGRSRSTRYKSVRGTKQLVPISEQAVVAGQPRAFQRQHDPGLAQPDIGDQVREALAALGGGAGAAQVIIDYHDLVLCPAQLPGAAGQVVLAGQALGVADRLGQRRLADIDVGIAPQVSGARLSHQPSPPPSASTPAAIIAASRHSTLARAVSGIWAHTRPGSRPAPPSAPGTSSISWQAGATLNART